MYTLWIINLISVSRLDVSKHTIDFICFLPLVTLTQRNNWY